jgi:hypothetical protein
MASAAISYGDSCELGFGCSCSKGAFLDDWLMLGFAIVLVCAVLFGLRIEFDLIFGSHV